MSLSMHSGSIVSLSSSLIFLSYSSLQLFFFFFFFNDTATTEIYTLSLHDALPIWFSRPGLTPTEPINCWRRSPKRAARKLDRKSTRLNSSHVRISYAVFCLKKKKKTDVTCDKYELFMQATLASDSVRLLVTTVCTA